MPIGRGTMPAATSSATSRAAPALSSSARQRPVIGGVQQAEDSERDMAQRLHLVVERRLEAGELPNRLLAAIEQKHILVDDDQALVLLMRHPLGARRLVDPDEAVIEPLQQFAHRPYLRSAPTSRLDLPAVLVTATGLLEPSTVGL